jgi:hypothetical protein
MTFAVSAKIIEDGRSIPAGFLATFNFAVKDP